MSSLKKFVGDYAYSYIKNIAVDADKIRKALVTPQNARNVFSGLDEFQIKSICTEISATNTFGTIRETTQEEIIEDFNKAGYDTVIFDDEEKIAEYKKEINELVKELKKQNNMTIISITHDIEEAKNADRVILLNKGEIVDCDKPQKILTNEKLLKELKLDIPFSLKIARKLQKKGYQIKDTLDVEELEKQLCQLHAKV